MGQSYKGIFSNKIPSSQVCLGLCQVDKNKYINRHTTFISLYTDNMRTDLCLPYLKECSLSFQSVPASVFPGLPFSHPDSLIYKCFHHGYSLKK